jgi:hypothetical protein
MDTQATHSRAMDIRVTRDTPLPPVSGPWIPQAIRDSALTLLHRAMGCQTTREAPPTPFMGRQATPASRLTRIHRAINRRTTGDALVTPLHPDMDYQARKDALFIPVRRATDTKAAPYTLPTPIPVMDLPSMPILATARRKTGRLEAGTLSSLLAEFRPRIHLQCVRPLAVARANASVKSIAPIRMGDPRSQQRHEDRQSCQHRMFAIGSFTLAARPSRRNLAPRPAKSGMPGKFPQ